MKNYILEAHQGVCTEYPSNTLSAFRAAVKQGYGMIELDTKFTADNHCVILHDETINRTGRYENGHEISDVTPISSMTLKQVRQLDFGISYDERFAGEKIPVLEEVLQLAIDNKILLKFDNVMQSHTEEQLEIFFNTIETMNALEYVSFTSDSLKFINMLLSRFPEAFIHYDGPVTDETLLQLSKLVPKNQLAVWLRFDNDCTSWSTTPPASVELSEKVHRYGKLGVWLLQTKGELQSAVELFGADLIETDGTLKPEKGLL